MRSQKRVCGNQPLVTLHLLSRRRLILPQALFARTELVEKGNARVNDKIRCELPFERETISCFKKMTLKTVKRYFSNHKA